MSEGKYQATVNKEQSDKFYCMDTETAQLYFYDGTSWVMMGNPLIKSGYGQFNEDKI